MRIVRLHLTNFLSYRDVTLELGDLTALVGPNASGKSNAVAALRLLHEIPAFGLQTAVARRGGFDSLRHRSKGRYCDPALRLEFRIAPGFGLSFYELKLASLAGRRAQRYEVELERGAVAMAMEECSEFSHRSGDLTLGPASLLSSGYVSERDRPHIPEGQSALPTVLSFGGMEIWELLSSIRTVEINPARIKELQDPSPAQELEPDGSNAASCFEALEPDVQSELVAQLAAIVPAVERIEPRHLDDKMTLRFHLRFDGKLQDFSARQMSDGTLRIFGILLALVQPGRPTLVVIEEPETAIHLGALRSVVEIMRAYSPEVQVLITTHSADIVDSLDLDELRVVWPDDGTSRLSPVASHTRDLVRQGLVTPGELLRSDALDPAVA